MQDTDYIQKELEEKGFDLNHMGHRAEYIARYIVAFGADFRDDRYTRSPSFKWRIKIDGDERSRSSSIILTQTKINKKLAGKDEIAVFERYERLIPRAITESSVQGISFSTNADTRSNDNCYDVATPPANELRFSGDMLLKDLSKFFRTLMQLKTRDDKFAALSPKDDDYSSSSLKFWLGTAERAIKETTVPAEERINEIRKEILYAFNEKHRDKDVPEYMHEKVREAQQSLLSALDTFGTQLIALKEHAASEKEMPRIINKVREQIRTDTGFSSITALAKASKEADGGFATRETAKNTKKPARE